VSRHWNAATAGKQLRRRSSRILTPCVAPVAFASVPPSEPSAPVTQAVMCNKWFSPAAARRRVVWRGRDQPRAHGAQLKAN
jgi:hypothetical protein